MARIRFFLTKSTSEVTLKTGRWIISLINLRRKKWSAQLIDSIRTRPKQVDSLSLFKSHFFLMVNRPFGMNLQCSSPVAPCIRRVPHKRLDSDDQPPAKCARLSADSGDPQGLLGTSPSSPVGPTANPVSATHQGPSRIGAFLLLPLADRESVHGAMNTDTGDELLCKVCAIQGIVQFSLNE
ncbi:hypothetical protein XENOCAPTIV_002366 [Xenoophorus captivus]|uniref:Uncharacterized protein n=1 Tax=Xenoophorus captivus TaxID=1517983 RepID=A0ABV0RWF1_9TELE